MNNLKKLRIDKKLTQKELAHIVNVSQNTICQWETEISEPGINNLKTIAKFFGVTVDYLIGLEPDSGLIYVHKDPALTETEKQLIAEFRKSKRAAQKFIFSLEEEEQK